uniref:Anaphase-promoting complex subunit 13 n=1 Tax=Steinernema glaseri TaxID=37863 RepID=A0A1I7YA67_9BILA
EASGGGVVVVVLGAGELPDDFYEEEDETNKHEDEDGGHEGADDVDPTSFRLLMQDDDAPLKEAVLVDPDNSAAVYPLGHDDLKVLSLETITRKGGRWRGDWQKKRLRALMEEGEGTVR